MTVDRSRLTQMLRGGTPARLAMLAVTVLVFAVTTSGFFNTRSLFALGQNFALVGLATLAISLPMLVGEFDLSVGPMVAASGLVAVKLGTDTAMVGIAAAIGFGLVVGLTSGLLIVLLRLSSLVVTLGVMMLLNGFAFWLAGGRVITYPNFEVGQTLDRAVLGVLSIRSFITIGLFVLAALLLRRTLIGRDIYATGSDRVGARNAGARTHVAVVFAFCWSGALTACAGALLSVSLSTASATFGVNILLTAASAAIIGGVALSGGVGSPLGVAIGALILAVINNGLSLAGASSAAILLTNGLVLLAVVVVQGTPIAPAREAIITGRRRLLGIDQSTVRYGEGGDRIAPLAVTNGGPDRHEQRGDT